MILFILASKRSRNDSFEEENEPLSKIGKHTESDAVHEFIQEDFEQVKVAQDVEQEIEQQVEIEQTETSDQLTDDISDSTEDEEEVEYYSLLNLIFSEKWGELEQFLKSDDNEPLDFMPILKYCERWEECLRVLCDYVGWLQEQVGGSFRLRSVFRMLHEYEASTAAVILQKLSLRRRGFFFRHAFMHEMADLLKVVEFLSLQRPFLLDFSTLSFMIRKCASQSQFDMLLEYFHRFGKQHVKYFINDLVWIAISFEFCSIHDIVTEELYGLVNWNAIVEFLPFKLNPYGASILDFIIDKLDNFSFALSALKCIYKAIVFFGNEKYFNFLLNNLPSPADETLIAALSRMASIGMKKEVLDIFKSRKFDEKFYLQVLAIDWPADLFYSLTSCIPKHEEYDNYIELWRAVYSQDFQSGARGSVKDCNRSYLFQAACGKKFGWTVLLEHCIQVNLAEFSPSFVAAITDDIEIFKEIERENNFKIIPIIVMKYLQLIDDEESMGLMGHLLSFYGSEELWMEFFEKCANSSFKQVVTIFMLNYSNYYAEYRRMGNPFAFFSSFEKFKYFMGPFHQNLSNGLRTIIKEFRSAEFKPFEMLRLDGNVIVAESIYIFLNIFFEYAIYLNDNLPLSACSFILSTNDQIALFCIKCLNSTKHGANFLIKTAQIKDFKTFDGLAISAIEEYINGTAGEIDVESVHFDMATQFPLLDYEENRKFCDAFIDLLVFKIEKFTAHPFGYLAESAFYIFVNSLKGILKFNQKQLDAIASLILEFSHNLKMLIVGNYKVLIESVEGRSMIEELEVIDVPFEALYDLNYECQSYGEKLEADPAALLQVPIEKLELILKKYNHVAIKVLHALFYLGRDEIIGIVQLLRSLEFDNFILTEWISNGLLALERVPIFTTQNSSEWEEKASMLLDDFYWLRSSLFNKSDISTISSRKKRLLFRKTFLSSFTIKSDQNPSFEQVNSSIALYREAGCPRRTLLQIEYKDSASICRGVLVDWLLKASQAFISHLFHKNSNYLTLPKGVIFDFEILYNFGYLLGVAFIHSISLPFDISPFLWKFIVADDYQVTRDDLLSMDKELFLNVFRDDLGDTPFMDFEFEFDGLLLFSDESRSLNSINVVEYQEKVSSSMNDFLHCFFAPISEAFLSTIPVDLHAIVKNDFSFISSEIEGIAEYDLESWKANSKYDRESCYSDWFWQCVERMSFEEKKKLLTFVTGSFRLPSGGFAAILGVDGRVMPFTILFKDFSPPTINDTFLPSAQTCFNTLTMPMYSSMEIMEEKLLYAINITEMEAL